MRKDRSWQVWHFENWAWIKTGDVTGIDAGCHDIPNWRANKSNKSTFCKRQLFEFEDLPQIMCSLAPIQSWILQRLNPFTSQTQWHLCLEIWEWIPIRIKNYHHRSWGEIQAHSTSTWEWMGQDFTRKCPKLLEKKLGTRIQNINSIFSFNPSSICWESIVWRISLALVKDCEPTWEVQERWDSFFSVCASFRNDPFCTQQRRKWCVLHSAETIL